jgi:formamidopyrimidine-DNA glycosylase
VVRSPMPERPDLEYQVPLLADGLRGAVVTGVRVRKPVVLRAPVPIDVLIGARFLDVRRLGHFVAFTLDGEWDIGELVKKRREQIKVVLMDKATFDSFGNAYADETLWEAGIHPKATACTLTQDQLVGLHAAMRTVLGGAIDEIRRRSPPLDEKVRDFVKVRNRGGEPCPRCGGKIRSAGVRGHDAFFCPTCQPDTAGKGFVGWR